ncbi:tRNA (guanosine(37)-N1)-methyltransferase TrmD [Nannocystis sp.]|uniref:tRNA (guanosine(37)-N1)-methyltransferase TrmD n=1 Tax=Nannocystis sp. TaxID=1962667 RepID=UPI0025D26A26|nr:tRNA (guanosine(37)-N1)-methyltransferase TrmD [Nannocystis sp.]MBK7825209.1 tRNA (guanosine(37)-N1)-methyltransferase TrmD [Nannocystis sp.]
MSGPTFEVFTLFPDAISGFLRGGLIGKAAEQGLVTVHCTDYRDYTHDRHRTVDDAPYGGGPGMVMKIEPVAAALEAVTAARGPMHRILLTPSAPRFDQRAARRLAALPRIALLCGRYEGIDDRVREAHVDECLSLGDFVLNGGEVAALAIVEAVARLCEGVLGNPESAARDSFMATTDLSEGTGTWLEGPQYTRPPVFRGVAVPPVLLAGDHDAAGRWRATQAWRRTWALRPDLRPRRVLPATTPIYLAREPGLGDLPEGAAALPGVSGLLTHARTADLRTLRRTLKRRHGVAPELVAVVVGPIETSLPQAHSGAALLDLLALSGDLSAPLVLLLCPTPTALGDLTPASPSAREEPQDASSWPSALRAVFALDPLSVEAAALELARWAPMIDSSPPQPVCGSAITIAAAALSELRTPAAR